MSNKYKVTSLLNTKFGNVIGANQNFKVILRLIGLTFVFHHSNYPSLWPTHQTPYRRLPVVSRWRSARPSSPTNGQSCSSWRSTGTMRSRPSSASTASTWCTRTWATCCARSWRCRRRKRTWPRPPRTPRTTETGNLVIVNSELIEIITLLITVGNWK